MPPSRFDFNTYRFDSVAGCTRVSNYFESPTAGFVALKVLVVKEYIVWKPAYMMTVNPIGPVWWTNTGGLYNKSIYVQLAVFRSIGRNYDRDYEKGILKKNPWPHQKTLHNSLSLSSEYSHEDGEEKSHEIDYNINDTHFFSHSGESRRSPVLKWFKELLVTTEPTYYYKPFVDMTREKKDQREEQVTAVLLKLVNVLDGLNRNLKETENNGYLTLRVPVNSGILRRYKREVSIEASNEAIEDQDVSESNVTVKDNSSSVNDKNDTLEDGKMDEEITDVAKVDEEDGLIDDNPIKNADSSTKKEEIPAKDLDNSSKEDNPTLKDKIRNIILKNIPVKAKNTQTRTKVKSATSKDIDSTTTDNNSSLENSPVKDTSTSEEHSLAKDNSSSEESSSTKDKSDFKNSSASNKSTSKENTSEEDSSISDSTSGNDSSEEQSSLLQQLPIFIHGNTSDSRETKLLSGRRSLFVPVSSKVKEKLLVYLEDMFNEIARKIQPLTRVKIALSPDNSYRIGYIVANIDTLEIKLKRLKQDMKINKNYWNDAKVMELFDQLKVTYSVVSSLMDTLTTYLPIPII